MMQHYFRVKEAHKDCVVFYRLGDFYEMFFDDAVKVSRLLDLTLTGRDCGLSERAPMCGIPYHAADGYIAKLVALGEKIAICEQLSDPTQKNKSSDLVERDVIRIISAGTLTEDSMLDEKKNNFIASVCRHGDVCGAAWADITTGEFQAAEFSGADSMQRTADQLVKLAVSEIISDDANVRRQLRYMLRAHGAVTVKAATAAPHTKIFSMGARSSVRLRSSSPNTLPKMLIAAHISVYLMYATFGHIFLKRLRLSTAVIRLLPARPIMYE